MRDLFVKQQTIIAFYKYSFWKQCNETISVEIPLVLFFPGIINVLLRKIIFGRENWINY